jgi:hypothetical protein
MSEALTTTATGNTHGTPLCTFARASLHAEAEPGAINTVAEPLTRRTGLS